MERHNIWRVSDNRPRASGRHRWQGCTEARFRPAERPVADERPRCEQTWPAQPEVLTRAPRMISDDAHPGWPGRRRPAVPCYQRRLDRHTDGIVRAFRVGREQRTVTGRRRGMTTHRRPVAVMPEPVRLGRVTDAHYEALYGHRAPTYRRLGLGGERPAPAAVLQRVRDHLRGVLTPSPRRAMVATIAVVVLVMSTINVGFV